MSSRPPPRHPGPPLGSVLGSLLAALGEPRREPSGVVIEPARAAVLLLVDGLGEHLLRDNAADAPFLASLPDLGPLAVGFPSSTAPSLTSLSTGAAPGAHGMVGTSFRVAETELLDALRWSTHGAGPVDLREEHPPEQVQVLPTHLERAAAAGIDVTVVSPRAFRDSGLTRATLRGGRFTGHHALGDLAARIVTAVAGPGRRLCYAYHADLDLLGHLHGPGTLSWRLQLTLVDRLVEQLAAQLPRDAVLAVTGDHGMVAMDRTIDADTNPHLRHGLALLGGDPRARHAYAVPGAAADLLATWREVLGDTAWTVSREQAVDEGWFGPVGPQIAPRLGDVVTAARGRCGVVRSVAEPFLSSLLGQHGSLSAEEQLVPLLIARAPWPAAVRRKGHPAT